MDPSASSFERDLLESWSAEQPSPAARARALALGGLAASGAALVGTGAAAPKALGLAGMAFVKWGILAVLIIGGATATIMSVTSSSKAPVAATTAPAVVAPPVPVEPAAPPAPESVAAADLPAAVVTAADAPAPARTVTTTTTAATAPSGDSLAEEIAAFDGVRAANASGDADRTLALAGAYERRYPNGTFLQEAEVLRIESLAKKGDRVRAARVGREFLAAHPQSPHAGRIRAIVDASTP